MSIALYQNGSDNTLIGLHWKDFKGSKETFQKSQKFLVEKLPETFPTIDSDVLFFMALKDISNVVGEKLRGWKEEDHRGEKLLFQMKRRQPEL